MMDLSREMTIQRVPNFAVRRMPKCMNCSREIFSGVDMYSRRFCSVRCKEQYLL